jgi:thiamine biosynthesis protein ThiI
MRSVIIIKYGELWLKSEPVRNRFAGKLAENIRKMLKSEGIEKSRLARLRDMLILETRSRKAEETLKRAFGISWFARAEEAESSMKSIEKAVLKFARKIGRNKTFAIRASRGDKSFDFTSRDIEMRMGSKIKRKVDLTNPDFTIFVEVKKTKAYVYSGKVRGPGGMPYGVSGKVLSLISGGIDSPVASWMLMKRGCSVDFVHFYHERNGMKKVRELVRKLKAYSPDRMNLYAIPFGEVQEEISGSCESRMTCVLCKRMMYRTSEMLAGEMGAKALVTGENLAQVASQTLENLIANTSAVSIPVLRPLMGMDKEETVSIAKRIGTYGISIKDAGICRFVPRRPATRARIHSVLREEGRIRNISELLENIIGRKERFVV